MTIVIKESSAIQLVTIVYSTTLLLISQTSPIWLAYWYKSITEGIKTITATKTLKLFNDPFILPILTIPLYINIENIARDGFEPSTFGYHRRHRILLPSYEPNEHSRLLYLAANKK